MAKSCFPTSSWAAPTHTVLQTRILLVPSFLNPTRAAPQVGQTSATFEMLIGDSCSAMPPLVRCPGLARNGLLDHAHMLDQHGSLVGKHAQHALRLAAVGAREHLDRIVAMNT